MMESLRVHEDRAGREQAAKRASDRATRKGGRGKVSTLIDGILHVFKSWDLITTPHFL